MSIRKRYLPSGNTIYEVRWIEGTKKKSKAFERKFDAEQFERKAKHNREQRSIHEGWNRSVRECAIQWIEFQEQQTLALGTKVRIRQIVDAVIVTEFGDRLLSDLNPGVLEPWIGNLRRKKLAAETINKFLQVFKSILNYEVRMGRIPYNPINGFRLLKVPMQEFLVWDQNQVGLFLQFAAKKYSAQNHWVQCAYLLSLNTGLRSGELWGLRWTDILWKDGLIKVEQTCDRLTRAVRIGTKGNRVRYVPLTQPALKSLLNLLELRGTENQSKLVFNVNGRPINHDNFRRDFWLKDINEATRKFGMREIRFHDLRHTAATLMLKEGLSAAEVQQILGHSSITTTMRYVHLLGSQSAQRASQIFGVGASGKFELGNVACVQKKTHNQSSGSEISEISENSGRIMDARTQQDLSRNN
jgi:integrase